VSPSRAEIDKALIHGEAYRKVSERFDSSPSALQRHKAEHLPALVAEAAERVHAEAVDYAVDSLRDILDTRNDAKMGAKDALAAGRFAGAGSLLAVRLKANELLAELDGKLNRGTDVNILVQIQQRLAGGLDAETRVQVAALLDTIEAPPEPAA
jgi:hypothetical protein